MIKSVLIAAGGTGGHVFPGIAVAKELSAKGINVVWLGTIKGLEAKVVPQANISFYPISIQGLRGKGKLSLLTAPFKLFFALYQAIKIIRQTKADSVLGMGGYVSGPAGLAAFLLRKPLYIHEQNAIAGLTNRLLSRLSTKVFTGFPNVFPCSINFIETGNPVRADLLNVESPEIRFAKRGKALRVLLMGGSQGASFLNNLILALLDPFSRLREKVPVRADEGKALSEFPHPAVAAFSPSRGEGVLFKDYELEIYHQTGPKDFEKIQAQYQALGLKNITVKPFIDDMPAAYSWADLVICRAGALTVAELAAVGVASILVPFPSAVDDHQTHNAQYLVKAGAAILSPQSELKAKILSDLLKEFIANPERLLTMGQSARHCAKVHASELVVKAILG
jgi:UDP-N-acetylglucosamine--N-acetylmuramyl-(pentapeptide) pyrophosphoryl-undecaprenol N-acetylglucosamine transferase